MSEAPTLDRIAHALSDPLRLRVLDLLRSGRPDAPCSPLNPGTPGAVCACDLRPALQGMAPSKLAYHLKELRQAGLLREEQRGKWVYYTLDREALTDFQQRLAARYGLGR